MAEANRPVFHSDVDAIGFSSSGMTLEPSLGSEACRDGADRVRQCHGRDRAVTDHDQPLHLTDAEIARTFSDNKWAEKFPPVLTVDEAAQLVGVPKATLYNWSSRGLLRGCARKVGRHLRIVRDKFIKRVFNEGLNDVK